MIPAKLEVYERTIYVTCTCGQRYSPNNIAFRPRRYMYGHAWVITVCDRCNRQLAVVDSPTRRYEKPPILCGIVARFVRV